MRLDAETIAALAPARAFALDGKVAVVTGTRKGFVDGRSARPPTVSVRPARRPSPPPASRARSSASR